MRRLFDISSDFIEKLPAEHGWPGIPKSRTRSPGDEKPDRSPPTDKRPAGIKRPRGREKGQPISAKMREISRIKRNRSQSPGEKAIRLRIRRYAAENGLSRLAVLCRRRALAFL